MCCSMCCCATRLICLVIGAAGVAGYVATKVGGASTCCTKYDAAVAVAAVAVSIGALVSYLSCVLAVALLGVCGWCLATFVWLLPHASAFFVLPLAVAAFVLALRMRVRGQDCAGGGCCKYDGDCGGCCDGYGEGGEGGG